ncbi:b6018af8-a052-4748-8d21-04c424f847d4 [Sclerotinia trifoliorum]|uniref:Polyprenal reductase n=1 Tax=Sclerotinia trifoliorum TaxID=28548 RepID=A0A8H2VQU6_9HELO|nr:b6018af8-a052-4748-8d21-04c424f847d4 [Sclerotinia trifoliorum]
MDIRNICIAFFVLGTTVDLGGTLIPSFRQHVMNYGSRGITPNASKDASILSKPANILEYIGSIQVPHTWFSHYYIVSVASSIFWAHQIIARGAAFRFIASYSQHDTTKLMTVNQIALAWGFMALQGSRRLYESFTLTKPSQSKMWIGLLVVGVAYYIFMGISVWIEGIATLNAIENPLDLIEISKPSLKTSVAVPLFVIASVIQHECHKHLASLKKYTLPSHPFFRNIVCPHYTSECLLYIAIAIVAAPQGQTLNRTVLAGLCFVISNLGVTADSTRKWYVAKFGIDNLKGRWRMLPYVY